MYRIEYNGTVIHDPSKFSSDCILMECTYSGEIGKVDTLDFTILPFHPFYNEFTRLQTGIVAYRDDHEIFRGRILSSSVDLYGNKKVQCEGSLAYLLDTIQPKMVYAEEDETAISGAQLFRTIIANHNSQVEEVKRFTVGEITALKANDIIEVNQTSYTETRSMIDQYLLNPKGGYLRVRYENGVQYIDWVEDFGRNPNQTIKVGANVISFTEEISADDFYTVLFPIGTEKAVTRDTEEEIEEDEKKDHTVTIASVNNDSPYLLVSQDFVNKYGYIYHNEDYGTVANPAELLRLANDTMAQFRKKLNRTVEIGGLDLHFIDSDVDQILLGDRVQIIAPNFNKNERLMLTKVDYDFQDPSKDKFSFGDGLQTLTKKTEANISHTSSTAKKAKNDSLTNGRDLFIKKNLIDIQAKEMSVKVSDAMTINANAINLMFRQLKWESEAYTEPNDMARTEIRNRFANEWSQVTRTMDGFINTEEGIAKFNAISEIVGSMGRQTNKVTEALDSDSGFFSWTATSRTISEQGNTLNNVGLILNGEDGTSGLIAQTQNLDNSVNNVKLTLNGPDGTGGLVAQVRDYGGRLESAELLLNGDEQTAGLVARTAQNASDIAAARLTLCGDENHPGIVSEVGQYIDGKYVSTIINQDANDVKIKASKVDLGNYATVQQLEANYVKATEVESIITRAETAIINDLSSSESQISELYAGDTYFDSTTVNTATIGELYLGSGQDVVSVSDGIKDVQIVGPTNNVYKLQYKRFSDATWQDASVTFSRATSLTSAYGGGTLKVGAYPQDAVNTYRNTYRFADVPPSDVTWDGSTASIPIKVTLNEEETVHDTGRRLEINFSDKYAEWSAAGWRGAKLSINQEEKEISITNQGDITSAAISAVPSIIYNSTTHTYTATATAKANAITMDVNSVVGNDQAYQDGVIYGASTGYAAARLSIDATNSKIDITNTGDVTSATIGVTAGISYNSSTHTYTATATADANGTDMVTNTATGGTEAYRAGYNANNTARLSTSGKTLGYGESVTVTAQYMTYDGDIINTSRTATFVGPADRYSQGQTAAGLSINASNHTINRATSSDTKSVAITLDIGASNWSDEDGMWVAPVTVKADSTVMYSQYCVTEAPPANAYDSGWSLGWDQGYTAGYRDGSGGQTPSTHYTAVSAKRASTLTLYSQNKMSMARYIDSEDRYVSAGYHYWYYSETKGFETLYARS